MKKYFIPILFIILFSGCREGYTDSRPMHVEQLSAAKIDEVSVSERKVSFVISCDVASPDYLFIAAEPTVARGSVTFKLMGAVTGSGVYPGISYRVDAPFTYTVLAPGEYTFRFLTNHGTTVDTTIVVE